MTRFSVVTPTRNSLTKLKCCVGSVRGQTGVEVEHLVHDACSTDGTVGWLSGQNDLDSVSENDSGMYDAINRGWSRASGDIVSWLNSDEQYLPGTLRAVECAFDQHPNVDMLFGDVIVVRPTGAIVAARRDVRLTSFYVANSFLHAYSCTMFFRRRLLDEGKLELDSSLRFAADMDLILRLLKSGVRIQKMERYLATFAFDGSNLSCEPGMLVETEIIRNKHRAFKYSPLRSAASACRNVERLLSGAYRRTDVSFDYCVNEIPEYVLIEAKDVPFSYETRSNAQHKLI